MEKFKKDTFSKIADAENFLFLKKFTIFPSPACAEPVFMNIIQLCL